MRHELQHVCCAQSVMRRIGVVMTGEVGRRSEHPQGGLPASERTTVHRAVIGLGLYAVAFGASFGAVSVSSGLSLVQTMLLSLVMFSGASQFAFVGVAATSAPLAAIPAALLLAVRNAFYGVTMSQILQPSGWRRVVAAQFVIDETTALAIGQPRARVQRYAFWLAGMLLFLLWNVGTLGGALIGSAVDPSALGLDVAAPAAFLALLWGTLEKTENRWVAVVSAVVALAMVPLVPNGVPVLSAAAVAVTAGLLSGRKATSR
jgi:4-azaleucine resistance transporter AzlC